jgi:hypothetical protein
MLTHTNLPTSEDVASQNVTRMILYMILIYYFGYAPYTFRKIYLFFVDTDLVFDLNRNLMGTFLAFLLVLFKSTDILIYYNFNTQYRKVFLIGFKKFINDDDADLSMSTI